MNAAEKGKLMRMAGNIAAGFVGPIKDANFNEEFIAHCSIRIAEAIIRQINNKFEPTRSDELVERCRSEDGEGSA